MRKILAATIGFLALAGLIGYGATHSSRRSTATSGAAPEALSTKAPTSVEAFAPDAVPGEPATGRGEAGVGGDLTFGDVPAVGPSIVKTADLAVRVDKNRFQAAYDAATGVAERFGGFVASSTTAGTKSHRGSLVIRVPAAAFQQALDALRDLGTVTGQTISGQDVSAQFVDLEARLRTWEAQEAVLLKLMRRATSIEGTLRVQRELQDVQLRIEQIKGQLRVLSDQTDMATITLGLREAGAPPVVEPVVAENPSLVEAWKKAFAGFLGVLYSVVVGLGYLVPIALILLMGWLGWRRVRAVRAMRPSATG